MASVGPSSDELLSSLIDQVRVGQLSYTTPNTVHTNRTQQTTPTTHTNNTQLDHTANTANTKSHHSTTRATRPTSTTPPPTTTNPTLDANVASLLSVGEQCITEPELRSLLAKKPAFVLYDGFEPSGRMHIAQGVFKAMNVNKCTAAGGTFIFWVADWFALMNDKMGGDLARIRTVGEYLIQVWTAAGMDMSRVKFLWSSDEINKHAERYWTLCLDIARRFSLERICRCGQIMGRKDGSLTAAQVLYPLMQCTDIFFLEADVCQLGMDQRKVNMLAREYCDSAGRKLKPIVLSHHMLYGLKKGQQKMSKSDRDSAIFMEDSAADVERKIGAAHCPLTEEHAAAPAAAAAAETAADDSMQAEKDALMNPCLDYVKHIIFAAPDASFEAGGSTFADAAAVQAALLGGELSEADLKAGLVASLNRLLQPVRDHFCAGSANAAMLEQIKGWMAEPKCERSAASVSRLDARRGVLSATAATTPLAMVLAPLASARPSVESAVGVLRCLGAVPAGSQRVLWLPDWSSFVLGALAGAKAWRDDLTSIRAAYDLFVGALRVLSPELMAATRVVRQSDAILEDPSSYWVSVINAGRKHTVEDIKRVVGGSNHRASQVVATLMLCADVLALCSAAGEEPSSVVCVADDAARAEFAAMHAALFSAAVAKPNVNVIALASLSLKQPAAEGTVDIDGTLFLLDGKVDVQRKMKKAFCEPGNTDFCPPLAVACDIAIGLGGDTLSVGDTEYGAGKESQLVADFASGAVHPSDLKPVVRDAAWRVLERVRAAVDAQPALSKAEKELAKVVKRDAKKK